MAFVTIPRQESSGSDGISVAWRKSSGKRGGMVAFITISYGAMASFRGRPERPAFAVAAYCIDSNRMRLAFYDHEVPECRRVEQPKRNRSTIVRVPLRHLRLNSPKPSQSVHFEPGFEGADNWLEIRMPLWAWDAEKKRAVDARAAAYERFT